MRGSKLGKAAAAMYARGSVIWSKPAAFLARVRHIAISPLANMTCLKQLYDLC